MTNRFENRPGFMIFAGGIICIALAVGFGAFVKSRRVTVVCMPDSVGIIHVSSVEAVGGREASQLAAHVDLLMWMVFGLGVGLTLLGLRIALRPAPIPDSLSTADSITSRDHDPLGTAL